jgi:hypothetical protein
MYLTSDAFVFLLLLGSAKAHLLRGGRQSGALNSTHQLHRDLEELAVFRPLSCNESP